MYVKMYVSHLDTTITIGTSWWVIYLRKNFLSAERKMTGSGDNQSRHLIGWSHLF